MSCFPGHKAIDQEPAERDHQKNDDPIKRVFDEGEVNHALPLARSKPCAISPSREYPTATISKTVIQFAGVQERVVSVIRCYSGLKEDCPIAT